jgi:hypothetical protein
LNSTLPLSPPYNSACTSGYPNSPSGIGVDSNGTIYTISEAYHYG